MKKHSIILCVLLSVFSNTQLLAHGGQFRGPGDVQPPASTDPAGGSGGNSAAGGPGNRTPSGGSTLPSAGGLRPASIPLGPDLSRWQFWWEFNKAPYLDLKRQLGLTVEASDESYMAAGDKLKVRDNLQPTRRNIRDQILPRLRQAILRWDQRDMLSACMIALAKIGMDHPNFRILPLMRDQLRSSDQEIRETAALAMGISQMPGGLEDLIDLVEDKARGRQLMDRSEVDERSRSFAAYGLGLLAHSSKDLDLKRRVFACLSELLQNEDHVSRNLQVAAIQGLSLLNPRGESYSARVLMEDCLQFLATYYANQVGAGSQLMRAHVPTALARILGDEQISALSAWPEHLLRILIADLKADRRGRDRDSYVLQSVVLSIGRIAGLCRDEKLCREVNQALIQHFLKGKDAQSRYFCLIALGQIGGAENRRALLEILNNGGRALVKPWAAISLGILTHETRLRSHEKEPDREVGKSLLRWFDELKNPDAKAALALGLGLCGYTESADTLREQLLQAKSQDQFAGYLCISLALMDDFRSTADLRGIMRSSSRRPELLRQSATALGRLGDQRSAVDLVDLLETGSQNLAKLSAVASAISLIGDRRSIDPILEILFDDELTPLSRAFAAVALGGIADKELLPWNSKLAQNINYRANVETLTDGAAGILDIL